MLISVSFLWLFIFFCIWLIVDSFLQRYVPFAAVAAANCINVPLMRQNELVDGIVVCDENGNELVKSKVSMSYKLLTKDA